MLRAVVAAAGEPGVRIGLIATTFGFGLRHGIDWDHIAAISDITSSQETSRTSMVFATLYALGHASVVFVLGVVAIALGGLLPSSVDSVMGRIVGVTLIVLGVYVFYALIRHGRDFRMRSRWMLLFAGARKGVRWMRTKVRKAEPRAASAVVVDSDVEHAHEHMKGTPHHELFENPASVTVGKRAHTHTHRHPATPGDDAFMNYGRGTSFAVGMIHGVGAQTPSQVLIFLAAAGAAGASGGVFLLVVFLLGLVASNTAIALASTFGFLAAGRNFAAYAVVAVVTGSFSLVLGFLFLLDKGSLLPAIFGG